MAASLDTTNLEWMALDNLQISSVIVNQIADLQEFRFLIQVPLSPLANGLNRQGASRQGAKDHRVERDEGAYTLCDLAALRLSATF